jgi:hypothetical protein
MTMNAISKPMQAAPAGIVLTSRAMLAGVTIRRWEGRKLDKRVTSETNAAHGAESDAGRFNKLLIGKAHIDAIAKIAGKARNEFYAQTLPWLDSGGRILPAAGYDRFMADQGRLRAEFGAAVRAFVAAYPGLIEESRGRLGSMFNAADYPSPQEIAGRFGFDIGIMPLPAAGDFRIDRPDSDAIRAQIEARTQEALEAAMRDAWQRIAETVGHMAEKLRAYQPARDTGKAQNVFRDSLVENVRDLVALMPGFNLTGSPAMERVRALMETYLCKADAETLRNDPKVRGETAVAAEKIQAAMQSFI